MPAIDSPGVLITRPADQIEEVAALIERGGARAVPFPLLEILPISQDGEADRAIMAPDKYQLSIFISRNAVRFGVPILQGLWQELPQHMLWVGVGGSTAAEMKRAGMAAASPALASSEGVLSMAETRDMKGKRVLIIRGEGAEKCWLQRCGNGVRRSTTWKFTVGRSILGLKQSLCTS